MSEENRFENLRREMQANVASGVLFVPYLAWFLNSVMTTDTLFELRRDRELGFKNKRFDSASVSSSSHKAAQRTSSGKRTSWRDSVCSVSLPSSPAHSINSRKTRDEEKAQKRGVVLSKSENDLESSDSSIGVAISCGSGSQLAITRSHSTQIIPSFTFPCAMAVASSTDPKNLFPQHPTVSSESSIDEHSPQTDSAVVLESLGCLSPVQQQQHALGSSSCINSLPCHPRTNSTLSYSDDYVLPEVEVSFEYSDADDETDGVFETSFANPLATASLPPITFESTKESPALEVSDLVEDVAPNGNSSFVSSGTSIIKRHLVSKNNLSSLPSQSLSTQRSFVSSTIPRPLIRLASITIPQEFVAEKEGDSEDSGFSISLGGFAYYSQQCGILLSSATPASARKYTHMSKTSCSNEIINHLTLVPKTQLPPSNGNGKAAQQDQLGEEEAKDDKHSGSTSSSSSDAEQEPGASVSLSAQKTIPSSGCQEHHTTSPVVTAPLRHNLPVVHQLGMGRDQHAPKTTLLQYQFVMLQYSEHLSKRRRLSALLKYMSWLSDDECLEISKQIEPNNHSL